MPDFNVRSDSVNVEQIMEQIRARIREKRGVDYTEQQIRELAAVKLEKFLDPKGVRSDLLEQFRKVQPAYEPPVLPNYVFEDHTLYDTHRGLLRWIRKLLNPVLKLFFNPNNVIEALHKQSKINTMFDERDARHEAAQRATERLTYELIHNLVVETTRLGIEVKNLRMRAESLASRLEFNERRARALESAVVYKPADDEPVVAQPPVMASRPAPAPTPSAPFRPATPPPAAAPPAHANAAAALGTPSAVPGEERQERRERPEGPGQRSRRRRRRRGRRGGGSAAGVMGGQAATPAPGGEQAAHGRRDETHDTAEPHETRPVATEDLQQFTGADAHPSEPVERPEQPPGHPNAAAASGTPQGHPPGHPNAAAALGTPPPDSDPDSQ